jgi:hypothetical protein
MEERLKTEKQMIRYLLGEMSIDEQIEMETGYFTDPENFNMLQVVEQDLIEGYINNKLSASGRAKFEQHFLSTPARREQVQFFKTLTKVIPFEFDQPVLAVPESIPAAAFERVDVGQKSSWWETIVAPFRVNKFAMGMSFAVAILILAIAGSWVLFGTRQQSGGELANANTTASPDKATNQQKPPEQQVNGSDIKQNNQDSSVMPVAPKPPAKIIASFILTIPSGVRGEPLIGPNTAPEVLRLPSGADSVQLTVNHQDAPYSRYRVSLQNITGKQLWSRTDVKASRVKSGTSLLLNVPARQFSEGSYILSVSRNNTEGEWVVFRDFLIEVVGKN